MKKQFAVWLDYGHVSHRLEVCDNYERAFFVCLNVPGVQDFYQTTIMCEGEVVRRYPFNAEWRNRGLTRAEATGEKC